VFVCYCILFWCEQFLTGSITQRSGLDDEANASWFNIFNICERDNCRQETTSHCYPVFEVVSAYGTVGLSLGLPTVSSSVSSYGHALEIRLSRPITPSPAP
jgi:hypothetical protein